MKHTILGCITKYGIKDIKVYVESIQQSGFEGDKLMLCYDIQQETIDYLNRNGWLIVEGQLQEHVILQRFRDVYALLHQYDTDIVIWTDVKDVVFQKNPTEWIEQNIRDKDILAFSECVKLKDDPWAVVNSGTSFPMEWELGMKEEISYCAGTIVGKKNAIRDLFIDIYRWSKTTANPEQLSDQAAYNILLRLNQYSRGVDFVAQERGFITQLGTVWMKQNVLPLTELTPIYKDEKFYNQVGQEFCIVHQYDRDPLLKQQIYERYN